MIRVIYHTPIPNTIITVYATTQPHKLTKVMTRPINLQKIMQKIKPITILINPWKRMQKIKSKNISLKPWNSMLKIKSKN